MKPLKNPQRFWSKVDVRGPDDCWNWTACTVRGYGVIWHDGNNKRAPRVSYFLARGHIPDDLQILHSCDNPACVNPAHLSLGTGADNIRERDERGRTYRGERQHLAKLTERDVGLILGDGRSCTAVGRDYGVHPTTIKLIRQGKTWRHVPRVSPTYLRGVVNSIAGASG